jgi:hypothetical protein
MAKSSNPGDARLLVAAAVLMGILVIVLVLFFTVFNKRPKTDAKPATPASVILLTPTVG